MANAEKVYVFFSHAGGSGKTTLVRDLGYLLAKSGRRILLVDLDPQANLTRWVGLDPAIEDTAAVVVEKRALPEPKRVAFGTVGFDVLPSHPDLTRLELEVVRQPVGTLILRRALNPLRERYDMILVDSLPSLGPLAFSAALAADAAVVPVETTMKGAQTLGTTLQALAEYAEALTAFSPETYEGGRRFVRLIVPNHHDKRTKTDGPAIEAIKEIAGEIPVAPPLVSRPGPHREAASQGVPLPHLHPASPAAQELEAVLDAFLASVGLVKGTV